MAARIAASPDHEVYFISTDIPAGMVMNDLEHLFKIGLGQEHALSYEVWLSEEQNARR